MKDYYKILEVNKEATTEIIAKVYKILAKKYHPDLQDDKNKSIAEEKFKEISDAYEILSDEQKRKEYDEQLEASKRENNVDVNDYETLKNYCIQLENEITNLKNNYSSSTTNSYSTYEHQDINQNINNTAYNDAVNQAEYAAYNDAVNRAYHDAYVNNLRNLGYKIRYKKTFKENCKNLIALLFTGLIIFIIFKIIWAIPSCKDYIISLFTI